MKENENMQMGEWVTARQSDSTHMVYDGGCIYFIAAPGYTLDEVADAFRDGYDGDPGRFEVTDLVAEEWQEFGEEEWVKWEGFED